MSDKANAIGNIQGALQELQSATEGIPDGRMSEAWHGEWSAKDILAHIASWNEFSAADIARISRGHMPCLAAFKESEVDSWNSFFMRPRRLFPLAQVRFESDDAHRRLLEALNGLPEAMFGPGVVANFAGLIAAHCREHAGHIRQWRQREGI